MNIPKRYQLERFQIIHFEELESTNEYAWNIISNSNPNQNVVIVADNQTHGIGQYGRKWEVQKGENLTFTIIAATDSLHISDAFHLNVITSLAICYAVKAVTNKELQIKWPNDIYYKNDKLCGTLIKNKVVNNHIKQTIIGIGLNVNQSCFSPGLKNPTSLTLITGEKYYKESILSVILDQIHNLFYSLQMKGYQDKLTTYNSLLFRRNKWHKYILNDEEKELMIMEVSSKGVLKMMDVNGRKINVSSGLEYIL